MIKKLLLFLLLSIPFLNYSTEYHPWYEEPLMFFFQSRTRYQQFSELSTGSHTTKYHANDFFQFFSLSINPIDIFFSDDYNTNWNFEIESAFAKTKKRHFGLDDFAFTGRYRWRDDIKGDPFSLTTGITASFCHRLALQDISSFHHGLYELIGHVAIGKECTLFDTWMMRMWGVLGLGISERGAPWIFTKLNWEQKTCYGILTAFADALAGFGNKNLTLAKKFRGYGPIRHRSLDVGLRYTWESDHSWSVAFQYAHRIYAKNFPKNVNLFEIILIYPFSLF